MGASRGGRRGVATAYRVWATRPDSGESILLEESRRAADLAGLESRREGLAFGRLVPEEDGRARFEIVLQEAPDRQRILSSRPHQEIHAKAADLPGLALAWSPDGRYLAVPFFQHDLGLAILRAGEWAGAEGRRGCVPPLLVARQLEARIRARRGCREPATARQLLRTPRQLAEIGQTGQVPVWSRDNETLLVVARRSGRRAASPLAATWNCSGSAWTRAMSSGSPT